MTSAQSGAIALLASAISYTLSVCAALMPTEMSLATPCEQWDLSALLAHLSESMADLEQGIRTGRLGPGPPDAAWVGDGDPLEALRDRAAELLCTAYGAPGQFVAVSGLPVPAGVVACTGAIEIAVHGWDVAAARSGGQPVRPIPSALATRLLGLCPLLAAGREGLFADPVEVPAQASPGDKLVGFLGRDPGTLARGPALVTDE